MQLPFTLKSSTEWQIKCGGVYLRAQPNLTHILLMDRCNYKI